MDTAKHRKGFTLIELSIVLVIIGLIVGGVLVGRDLIASAAIRAQVSQVERYNVAVNTFRTKYGYLPGDINEPDATKFGFMSRGTYPGQGDGNGIIETNCCNNSTNYSGIYFDSTGEGSVFWSDLSYANGLNVNLIDGSFRSVVPFSQPLTVTVASTGVIAYLPAAKIHTGSYLYVWSGGPTTVINGEPGNGQNYFGLSAVTGINNPGGTGRINSSRSLTVSQAGNMDKKMDDGAPQSGKVIAMYVDRVTSNNTPVWAGTTSGGAPYTTATAASSSTCFDNGGVVGTMVYSLSQNNGLGVNCALSFQFQ